MKLIEIQRSLKEKYGFHIVCIQSGKFYVFLNEDATLISDRFDFKLYGKEVLMTGFPVWFQIEKFVDFFQKENLSYAVLTQLKEVVGENQERIRRIVTKTSNPESLGVEFTNVRNYETPKPYEVEVTQEGDFLQAILKGYDPLTGEVLNDSSVWKHSHVMTDIETYLKINNPYNNHKTLKTSTDSHVDTSPLSDSDLTLLKYLLKKASLIVPNLTPREIEIIHLLYNVDSNKKTTLEEVGKKFDLSRERIRQIKEKVIRKIKSSTYFKVDSDLKEIKTQNDPIDNRFEKSRRKLDLYKINPTLDLAYYELPNISDIEKGIYFKLEQLKSFTPINYQLSKTWLDDFNLDELRKENILNNRLMNNGTPITQEEIGLIVTLYKNDFSLSNLEKYFQRSEKSIENIIKANELL
jgi:hypothetical protein